jgi:hypothetical protein
MCHAGKMLLLFQGVLLVIYYSDLLVDFILDSHTYSIINLDYFDFMEYGNSIKYFTYFDYLN